MKKFSCIFAFFLLSACTTAADVQRECRAITDSFVAEVTCIENVMQADPYLSGDSFAQQYVYEAKVLADRVRSGAMSENEARLELARSYNRMRLEQSRMEAYDALAWERMRPYDTDCWVDGDRIRCTSW